MTEPTDYRRSIRERAPERQRVLAVNQMSSDFGGSSPPAPTRSHRMTKQQFATYMRGRYRQNRARAMAMLGGKCSHCGSTDNLEFDHKDRKLKRAQMSHLWRLGWDRIKAELVKCWLLCKPCHEKKSQPELSELAKASWEIRPRSATYLVLCAACGKEVVKVGWRLRPVSCCSRRCAAALGGRKNREVNGHKRKPSGEQERLAAGARLDGHRPFKAD